MQTATQPAYFAAYRRLKLTYYDASPTSRSFHNTSDIPVAPFQ
jgi:hypothetical protein